MSAVKTDTLYASGPGAPSVSRSRSEDQERRSIRLVGLVTVVMALLYVFLIRPGVAADEPSHFDTIRYYATYWRMPVLGQPGVSYEGQMGPVYYLLGAVVYKMTVPLGEMFAFYTLRVLSSLMIVAAAWLAYLIVRRLAPGNPAMTLLTALFVGLNPSLLAIGSSLQNEMAAIVLSFWATYLAARWIQDEEPTLGRAALLGLVVGIAILAKATALFLIPAIPFFAWLVRGRRSVSFSAVFVSVVVLVSGWYFARNFLLYGDLTAQRALTKFHYGNNAAPIPLWQLHYFIQYLWGMVAYHWLPNEFYRHMFSAPSWVRGIVAAFTVLSLAGWAAWYLRKRQTGAAVDERVRAFGWFVAAQFIVSNLLYIYTCVKVTHFAPRSVFCTFFVYAALTCFGGAWAFARWGKTGEKTFTAILCAALLLLNLWVLRASWFTPAIAFIRFA